MSLDFTKPVTTVRGTPVTILSTSGKGAYSVVGHIGDSPAVVTWTPGGRSNLGSESPNDLVQVEETSVLYVNVSKHSMGLAQSSEQEADFYANDERISMLRIVIKGDSVVLVEKVPGKNKLKAKKQKDAAVKTGVAKS